MILNISPLKSFLASILAAITGTTFDYVSQVYTTITLDATNIAFQHCAWTIAILAGLVSAVNGILSAIQKIRSMKSHKNEEN